MAGKPYRENGVVKWGWTGWAGAGEELQVDKQELWAPVCMHAHTGPAGAPLQRRGGWVGVGVGGAAMQRASAPTACMRVRERQPESACVPQSALREERAVHVCVVPCLWCICMCG